MLLPVGSGVQSGAFLGGCSLGCSHVTSSTCAETFSVHSQLFSRSLLSCICCCFLFLKNDLVATGDLKDVRVSEDLAPDLTGPSSHRFTPLLSGPSPRPPQERLSGSLWAYQTCVRLRAF